RKSAQHGGQACRHLMHPHGGAAGDAKQRHGAEQWPFTGIDEMVRMVGVAVGVLGHRSLILEGLITSYLPEKTYKTRLSCSLRQDRDSLPSGGPRRRSPPYAAFPGGPASAW